MNVESQTSETVHLLANEVKIIAGRISYFDLHAFNTLTSEKQLSHLTYNPLHHSHPQHLILEEERAVFSHMSIYGQYIGQMGQIPQDRNFGQNVGFKKK